MPQPDEYAVPLLIGVTGHRRIDVSQQQPVCEAIIRLLRELRQAYPWTPLVILSPLAGDADRWVAEAVSEVDGAEFIAVLPWPRSLEPAAENCDGDRGNCALVDEARQIVVMPLAAGVDANRLLVEEAARQRQFDEVGRYIARQCQILMALWDGQREASTNTAKVIRYHAQGSPAPFSQLRGQLDTVDRAAVWEVIVRRRSAATSAEPSPEKETLTPRWSWPAREEDDVAHAWPLPLWRRWSRSSQVSRWRQVMAVGTGAAEWFWWGVRSMLLAYHHVLEKLGQRVAGWLPLGGSRQLPPTLGGAEGRAEVSMRRRWLAIDRFNRDIREQGQAAADQLSASRSGLIADHEARTLSSCVQELRIRYSQADVAAERFQVWRWWIVLVLFALALASVACLEIHAHKWFDPVLLVWYLGLLLTGYLTFRYTHWREHQGRWLDYRAFAEALRVQVFWRWAGMETCAADHYLRHFRGELEWIRHALRASFLIAGGHEPVAIGDADQSRTALERVGTCWVKQQQQFFWKNTPVNEELADSLHTATRIMLTIAVLLAGLQIFLQHDATHPIHGLVLATFFCLLIAAMLEKFGEIHAYGLLARRYRWMADLYEIADERLRQQLAAPVSNETIGSSRELLFELGCEALSENAEWVIQYRQRPPTLPSG